MAIIIPSSKIFEKKTNKVLPNTLKEIEVNLNNVDTQVETLGKSEKFYIYNIPSNERLSNGYYDSDVNGYRVVYGYEARAWGKKTNVSLSRNIEGDDNYYIESASPSFNVNYKITLAKCDASAYPDSTSTTGGATIIFRDKTADYTDNSYMYQYGLDGLLSQNISYPPINTNSNQNKHRTFLGVEITSSNIELSYDVYVEDNAEPTFSKKILIENGINESITNSINNKYFPQNISQIDNENSIDFTIKWLSKLVIYSGAYITSATPSGAMYSVPTEALQITFEAQDAELVYGEQVRTIENYDNLTKILTSDDAIGDEVISIGNNLIRTKNTYNGKDASNIYLNTLETYKKGKETLELVCAISDYYDDENNKVIAKDGSTNKMCFDLYDEVIPFSMDNKGTDNPISLNEDSIPKTFEVLGSRLLFDGALRQKLHLQEKDIYRPSSDLQFALNDDGTYGVIGVGENFDGYANVPSTYNGVTVTSINNDAFYKNLDLREIYVPSSVTKIGDKAFEGCANLHTIALNEGLTEINTRAFNTCTSLTQITIPNSVLSFGGGIFSGCINLEKIYLGDGVLDITSNFARDCTSLNYVSLPSNLWYLSSYCFTSCHSLTSIYLPKSIKTIYSKAFNDCTSLTKIEYEGSREEWNAITLEDGWVDDITKVTITFNA